MWETKTVAIGRAVREHANGSLEGEASGVITVFYVMHGKLHSVRYLRTSVTMDALFRLPVS